MSIQSFKSGETEALFNEGRVARFANIRKVAIRKLAMLDVAAALSDLKVPPNNRLETLKGDRKGQHSIRVNDQFRVCFVWTASGPAQVEIVDYH